MLSKRKPKKLSNKYVEKVTGYHELECSMCFSEIASVSKDIIKFTCSRCVQSLCAPPESYKKNEHEGYQRGWHFKKLYEAPDGKVYAFGKLINSDTEEVETSVDEPPLKKKRKTKTTSKKVSKPTKKRGQ
jgi:hypothetical protein